MSSLRIRMPCFLIRPTYPEKAFYMSVCTDLLPSGNKLTRKQQAMKNDVFQNFDCVSFDLVIGCSSRSTYQVALKKEDLVSTHNVEGCAHCPRGYWQAGLWCHWTPAAQDASFAVRAATRSRSTNSAKGAPIPKFRDALTSYFYQPSQRRELSPPSRY